jgi:1A family penicillin-binding protein
MYQKILNKTKTDQSWRNNKQGNRPKNINLTSSKIKSKFQEKNRKPSFFSKYFTKKNILIAGSTLCLLVILSVIGLGVWLSRDLPTPNQLISREVAQSTQILDSTGKEVLYEIHGEEKRTLVSLSEIPKYVQQATIAIEDKNFYEHRGFSLWAIFRTAVTNIIYRRTAGASTLTQQFIKNSVLTNEKKYTRKIKEFILAYRLEKQFSKDEILQMYLNEIPYGSTAYGVEAASRRYFGKSVKEINLAEAAILAALPQGPSRYSPYGSNKDILIGRQHYILDLMVKQGYINEEEAEAAKNFELVFEKPKENIKAPHFVMYIKEQLAAKYGEQMIEHGGLKIYTTLDLYKQKIAEEIIASKAENNLEKYNASNAGLVSIDPKTGYILAMVGSKDYFSEEIDGQVNITTSLRQPGSSLKPLVYAACFLKGFTPNSILYDVVTNFSNDKENPYEPLNYSKAENGPVSIRKALAGSLNIPAVKAIYLAGIDNVLDLASDLGYTTLKDKDRFGLSLVLGGGEVKLLEHTHAYSAFAREGNMSKLVSIIKIEDANGKVLEENKVVESKVMDPKAARMINDILSDNSARAYTFGSSNLLNLGERPVAAKTGTTNDYKDAWIIGYTPSIVTGVWVGNNDNTVMKNAGGGSVVAAPIWHEYMKTILGNTPVEYFKKPEIPKIDKPMLNGDAGNSNTVKIDKASGLLATELTPASYIEERTFSNPHSILYYIDKNDPLGLIPTNPAQDPQFALWENAVQRWAEKQASSSDSKISRESPPKEKDNLHIKENLPKLTISSPSNNQIIDSVAITITVEAEATRGIKTINYFLDKQLFASSDTAPYTVTKRIDFLENGFHNISVSACDDIENCSTEEVEFNLNLPNNTGKNMEVSSTITYPENGQAIKKSEFPLSINLNVQNISAVSKLNIYLIDDKSQKKIIQSYNEIEQESISYSWSNPPDPGKYKLSIETSNWKNETSKEEITIKIQ